MTPDSISHGRRADLLAQCRPELLSYATRLTARPDVAEEVVQESFLRLLTEGQHLPDRSDELRAWLFRVVSNLSIDHLRRHSTWRELTLVSARGRAEQDREFVAASVSMRGSPELGAIAREHLVVCFSCTARNLSAQQSAALLLREVHGFSNTEAAAALDATAVQVKNWVQQARRTMREKYAATCALVNKQGVCHQCVELDGFFNGGARDPLAGTSRDLDARIEILRSRGTAPWTSWHCRMMRFIEDSLIP